MGVLGLRELDQASELLCVWADTEAGVTENWGHIGVHRKLTGLNFTKHYWS